MAMETHPVPEWEVWYQDTFDRECPRQVELSGRGLARGLAALWARHLHETVRANGGQGFSRFNLWWKERRVSVVVVGDWGGQVRLRGWLFGDRQADRGYLRAADAELLRLVAVTHAKLLLTGQTSEGILLAASEESNRLDFEGRLAELRA